MPSLQISCPHCGNIVSIRSEWLGASLQCPICCKEFVAAVNQPVMPQVQPVKQSGGALGVLIPKNTAALLSYYFGVFSILIFFLGLPAIVCGIIGLCHAGEKGGVGHAITGIILGLIGPFILPALFWWFFFNS